MRVRPFIQGEVLLATIDCIEQLFERVGVVFSATLRQRGRQPTVSYCDMYPKFGYVVGHAYWSLRFNYWRLPWSRRCGAGYDLA
jgi:hypothetical protein